MQSSTPPPPHRYRLAQQREAARPALFLLHLRWPDSPTPGPADGGSSDQDAEEEDEDDECIMRVPDARVLSHGGRCHPVEPAAGAYCARLVGHQFCILNRDMSPYSEKKTVSGESDKPAALHLRLDLRPSLRSVRRAFLHRRHDVDLHVGHRGPHVCVCVVVRPPRSSQKP